MEHAASIASFRSQQAVHDLVQHAVVHAPRALSDLWVDGLSDLVERRCLFETNADLILFERLHLLAASPRPGPQGLIATAILLADEIQGGIALNTLDWYWEEHAQTYRAAPDSLRAALLNGFRRAAQLGTSSLTPAPDKSEFCTLSTEALLGPLRSIVTGITPQEIETISAADYGMDQDDHRAALNTLIFEQDMLLEDTQSWVPCEVIELIAHVPGTAGFVRCTALLLINALCGRDQVGWFEYRWDNIGQSYLSLPPHIAEPILAGIRHLYESDPEFLWYCTGSFIPDDERRALIPVHVCRDL